MQRHPETGTLYRQLRFIHNCHNCNRALWNIQEVSHSHHGCQSIACLHILLIQATECTCAAQIIVFNMPSNLARWSTYPQVPKQWCASCCQYCNSLEWFHCLDTNPARAIKCFAWGGSPAGQLLGWTIHSRPSATSHMPPSHPPHWWDQDSEEYLPMSCNNGINQFMIS